MITAEDALKFLARNSQKSKFMHKTRYGRSMEPRFSYDRKAHEDEYKRTKNIPFDPLIHL